MPVTRSEFLGACLDYTEHEGCEHLVVGYGYRYGPTTKIDCIQHVRGRSRSVAIPPELNAEIRRHHAHRSSAEVVVFHNHPRTGDEPAWFYVAKLLVGDLPVPSAADRELLKQYAYNALGLMRHLAGEGRVLFYLGESGFVREITLPNFSTIAEQFGQLMNAVKYTRS